MLKLLKFTLQYIKTTPIDQLDLDTVLYVIEFYNNNNIDPNEECPYEAAILGDIEVAYFNAESQIEE